MKGFTFILSTDPFDTEKEHSIYACEKQWHYQLNADLLEVFSGDKIIFDDDSFLIVLDGVILNKNTFCSHTDLSWKDIVINLYLEHGNDFFKKFRGSFAGIFIDKLKNQLIVFGDHIGSKPIFYYKSLKNIIFSTRISTIYDFMATSNISCNLSIDSAYSLLSYGYMLKNSTLCTDVYRVYPGHYITVSNKFREIKYYQLDNTPNFAINKSEAIDIVDSYFQAAINLQFGKDLEIPSCKHFVALSGGLDSRMTCWVAHELGYSNQLNFTFSQSGYLDQTIAQEISSDLQHDWLFKALDSGSYLFDVDEITEYTGGNVPYNGLSHGNSLTKHLSFKNMGMMHSGQLGDVIIGTYYSKPINGYKFTQGAGAHSHRFINKISPFDLEYPNEEIAKFYQRCFNGANIGLLAIQQKTETTSPFYDVDFLDHILKIPVELRWDHFLYKEWILKKYPLAATYKWEKINAKITETTIKINGNSIPLKNVGKKIAKKIFNTKSSIETKNHMNPTGYHLSTNQKLHLFFNNYINENMEYITNKELHNDMVHLIHIGTAGEKMQLLSLLSAVKRFHLK